MLGVDELIEPFCSGLNVLKNHIIRLGSLFRLGWGLLFFCSLISPLQEISIWPKETLDSFNHVHICQVSPPLSCGDTWQIRTCYNTANQCFELLKNWEYKGTEKIGLVNPTTERQMTKIRKNSHRARELTNCYPGYFRESHCLLMGLPEISRVTFTGMCCNLSRIQCICWHPSRHI